MCPTIYEHHQDFMDLLWSEYYPKLHPILTKNYVSFIYNGFTCAFYINDTNIANYKSIIDKCITDIDTKASFLQE